MKFPYTIMITMFGLAISAGAAAPAEIKMNSIGYAPKRLEVMVGQPVLWKNVAHTEHSAVSDVTNFDTGWVKPGAESKPVTFDKPGEYAYHCGLHGKAMNGVIVVKAFTK